MRSHDEIMFRHDCLGIDPDDDGKPYRPQFRENPDYDLSKALGRDHAVYEQALLYDRSKALDIVDAVMREATGWRREYLARLGARLAAEQRTLKPLFDTINQAAE